MCGRRDRPRDRAAQAVSAAEFMDDTLMFAIRGPGVAEGAANSIEEKRDPAGAMGEVWRYVRAKGRYGASLSLLHPERATIISRRRRWELGVALAALSEEEAGLAEIYVLRLASAGDALSLERTLGADRESIAYVHRPALRYPLNNPLPCPGGGVFTRDWGVQKCRFPSVWAQLDTESSDVGIAIIDQGRDEGHPELAGRITEERPPQNRGMDSLHGGAVAGIIGAIRDSTGVELLKGCCSAHLHLFNVWNANGSYDPCEYYRALGAVTNVPPPPPASPPGSGSPRPRPPRRRFSVVNLSIGGSAPDDTEKREVQACLARDVVLVASIGNLGSDGVPAFPAKYDRVVAVGGTTRSDVRVASSTRGDHMWISAPGELIFTIEGKKRYDLRTGTSFAAPFVTAAVWLARRRKPCLTVDEIRELLKKSVAPCTVPPGGRSADLGHGRLDMVELVNALNEMRDCG